VRFVRYALWSLLAIALALGAVVAWKWRAIKNIASAVGALKSGSEWTGRLTTPEGVLDYLAAHKADVSLASWRLGDEEHALLLNPDQPQPLASTVKILVLAAYAAKVADGSLSADESVAVSDWDKFYLPGTDGNAHPAALKALAEKGQSKEGKVRLAEVVWAMIRFSDNAATDFLLQRLGPSAVQSLPALVEEPTLLPPRPLVGAFLTWRGGFDEDPAVRLGRWSKPASGYAQETWRASAQLASDPAFRASILKSLSRDGIGLDVPGQESFAAALDNRGTARAYGRIMGRICSGQLPGAALMREALEWPMRSATIRAEFDQLGTKGGSLPGVLTAAYFAVPKSDGKPRVLALFMRNVPFRAWLELVQSFSQQELERKLLSDDAWVDKVRQRLGGP
jgi:D-alanyl-D-alanine carboxypeptidase